LFVCIHVCSHEVLIRSLHVSLHELWIGLLIEFSSKTIKQNTMKNKFIRYLCFIDVDFIHSCHRYLKMSSFEFGGKPILVNQSDLLAINVTTAFTILNCLAHESLKGVLVQEWQQSFWKFSILSNILDITRVFQKDEKFIHQLSTMFTCWDSKGGTLSSQA